METVRTLLEGWTVHYNFIRGHQTLKGKTPAQASGIDIENNWHTLVKEAIKSEVRTEMKKEKKPIMVIV